MKTILELNEMPNNCLDCPINGYETNENGELLYCVFLSALKGEYIEGAFLNRRIDCPLKTIE